MKITFLVHRYWPHVGGVEKYIHELAKALIGKGHDVTVVAGATTDGLSPVETHEEVRIRRFPANRSPLRGRLWMLRNTGLFRGADVVHISNTHMLEYFWRMVGPLVDRRKVFLTRHGMSYLDPVPESEKRRARRSLTMAAGVVHDGAFIEKWLEVAPDLCPNQGLAPSADELDPVPEPPPTSAVYIGRIEKDSGIEIYIDAVRRLITEYSRSFKLDVYGDGTQYDDLREQVRAEGLPIHFHGRVGDAQRFITEACFAFIDGRMAMQEAMARRRMVFAAYTGGLKRDYVGTEPFSPHLVAIRDGAELAEQVDRFIADPSARAAIVDRAFAHARTLTWDRTADAYLSFWHERLASPRPASIRLAACRLALTLNWESRRPKGLWAPAW